MLSLIEGGLATWRLTRLLVTEDGPYEIFRGLRERTGIEYGPGGVVASYPPWNPLHCVYCTSVYVGAIMLIAPGWLKRLLALSAIASLISIHENQ